MQDFVHQPYASALLPSGKPKRKPRAWRILASSYPTMFPSKTLHPEQEYQTQSGSLAVPSRLGPKGVGLGA